MSKEEESPEEKFFFLVPTSYSGLWYKILRNHSKCNSPIIRYRYLDHHRFYYYYYYYYYHYHYHDHYYYHYHYYFSPEGAYLSQAHLRGKGLNKDGDLISINQSTSFKHGKWLSKLGFRHAV